MKSLIAISPFGRIGSVGNVIFSSLMLFGFVTNLAPAPSLFETAGLAIGILLVLAFTTIAVLIRVFTVPERILAWWERLNNPPS
ncbi:hypothetical protein [Microterricola gilva]|uniref:hypothetical protein n=1 Tax=Microterricola gilva TaxID=393267 RepID=UPI001F5F3161|nr:hypothetical protein [Microterricola gilva]